MDWTERFFFFFSCDGDEYGDDGDDNFLNVFGLFFYCDDGDGYGDDSDEYGDDGDE